MFFFICLSSSLYIFQAVHFWKILPLYCPTACPTLLCYCCGESNLGGEKASLNSSSWSIEGGSQVAFYCCEKFHDRKQLKKESVY